MSALASDTIGLKDSSGGGRSEDGLLAWLSYLSGTKTRHEVWVNVVAFVDVRPPDGNGRLPNPPAGLVDSPLGPNTLSLEKVKLLVASFSYESWVEHLPRRQVVTVHLIPIDLNVEDLIGRAQVKYGEDLSLLRFGVEHAHEAVLAHTVGLHLAPESELRVHAALGSTARAATAAASRTELSTKLRSIGEEAGRLLHRRVVLRLASTDALITSHPHDTGLVH